MNVKEVEVEFIFLNLVYNLVNFKKEEDKLRYFDFKKVVQLERFGMGVSGGRKGIIIFGRGYLVLVVMVIVE